MERERGCYYKHNSNRDMYKDFIKKGKSNVLLVNSSIAYFSILSTLFIRIFKEIIFKGYSFRFRRLGEFTLIKYTPTAKLKEDGTVVTNKPVDFITTYKLRKEHNDPTITAYYNNEATGGYVYKFKWGLLGVSTLNIPMYKFQLHRTLKKLLHKSILDDTALAQTIDIKI